MMMMMMMMIIIIIIIVERVVVNCQLTSKSQLRLCAVVYVHQPRDAWEVTWQKGSLL